ncbi:hypothetical protein McanCB21832_000839 [Microsporum canis]
MPMGRDDFGINHPSPREPAPLRRANTSPKRPEGLFGFLSLRKPAPRAPEVRERPKSRSRHESSRRDTDREKDDSKRRKRSVRPDTDGEGFTTDAMRTGNNSPTEEAEARRAKRKAERARLREERDEKAREIEREGRRYKRHAREMEDVLHESKRDKKADRRSRSERPPKDPLSPTEGRRHRSHRTDDEGGKPRRRKSSPDNHRPRREKSSRHDHAVPYPVMVNGGKDKTSSWVKSQISDPPEAPPIVATVVDMPNPAREPQNASLSSDEEARRAIHRRSRRKSRAVDAMDVDVDRRPRRRESRREGRDPVRSNESSGDMDNRYGGMNPKRTSWFKKLTSGF